MIYSIDIAEAAENDIRVAFLYYENIKDQLGSKFENQIYHAVDSIQSNPFKTQIKYGNTRVYFLKTFPFGIHFQVKSIENIILIVAVFHTSLNPEKWKIR